MAQLVKEAVLHSLKAEKLTPSELAYIADIKDPEISLWLRQQVDSPDSDLSALANRLAAPRRSRLENLIREPGMPAAQDELFSTEADLDQVDALFRRLSSDGVLVPPNVRSGEFLSALSTDHWLIMHTWRASMPVCLWFRLVDSDTVRVVLSKAAGRVPIVH